MVYPQLLDRSILPLSGPKKRLSSTFNQIGSMAWLMLHMEADRQVCSAYRMSADISHIMGRAKNAVVWVPESN